MHKPHIVNGSMLYLRPFLTPTNFFRIIPLHSGFYVLFFMTSFTTLLSLKDKLNPLPLNTGFLVYLSSLMDPNL